MTRMLLTRHAESEWNALGRWQGQADPPLTDDGRAQAARAVAALGSVDAIAASTLDRASHTAGIISELLGIGPVVAAPALIERDAGEWSGLTKVEIDQRYPGYLDSERRPPGFESDASFLARVLAGLDELAHRVGPDGDVLVITHAGVIYTVEGHLGQSFDRIANLGGRYVEVGADGLVLGPRLALLADHEVVVPDPEAL